MNVLHHHLETVKTAGLGYLDFSSKSLSKIFEDDAIRGSEESKNVLNKVLLVICQLLPVLNVLSEIDFFSGPESSFLIFVHAPDVAVLNGE